MSVADGACDYCGEPLRDWYEVSAVLAASRGEFPLPLSFAAPPAFCGERCALNDLADRGFTVSQLDAEELSAREARARGRWPMWLETLSSLRTSPSDEGACTRCGRQLPAPAYEVLAFHPFTEHDIPEVLELAEPLPFCGEACARAELEARGLEIGRTRVWGSLWGNLTSKRAVLSVLKRKPDANEKEPKAPD